jgi:hypothetical protein
MTATLTDAQVEMVQLSAELHALSDCLKDDDPDEMQELLAQTLLRISTRLWHLVDEVGGDCD